jgi:glycosyltransferase involved in cell wall biosynthesis
LGYALAPALHAYFPNIPFVDYVHMEEENYRSGGYAMDSVRHRETLAMTGVTSNHLRDWMRLREKNVSRVKTIYINVNTEYWKRDDAISKRVKHEQKISEKQIVILYACRFVAQKQPDVFVATVERVLEKTKSVTFLIAGDGPERTSIQSLVKKHPQNIRYLGAQPSQKIGELLNASDIAFLPSEMEGIALFFYEAMSMSVVPVGANVGGQAELVTSECGILIKKRSKEEEAIEYANVILKLSSKPELLSEMKKQSRQRIENSFRVERMGEAMLAMFDQAVIENKKQATMSEALAESYISEVIEQFRLANLAEELWTSQSKQAMNDQFRNSKISPKFSKTKRNILRFLMKNL